MYVFTAPYCCPLQATRTIRVCRSLCLSTGGPRTWTWDLWVNDSASEDDTHMATAAPWNQTFWYYKTSCQKATNEFQEFNTKIVYKKKQEIAPVGIEPGQLSWFAGMIFVRLSVFSIIPFNHMICGLLLSSPTGDKEFLCSNPHSSILFSSYFSVFTSRTYQSVADYPT